MFHIAYMQAREMPAQCWHIMEPST